MQAKESVGMISKTTENFQGETIRLPDYIYWGESKSINIDEGLLGYKDVAMF